MAQSKIFPLHFSEDGVMVLKLKNPFFTRGFCIVCKAVLDNIMAEGQGFEPWKRR
jgi:hypothetical protein